MEMKTAIKVYPSYCDQMVTKSGSSTNFDEDNPHLIMQEAKSFTGMTENLKSNSLSETKQELTIEDYNEIPLGIKVNSKGFQTRELSSNQIFFVKEEMLTYRGKRYSFNDIATNWKKDCRKWLWKCQKGGSQEKKYNNMKKGKK
ncbi:hypothetical protein RI129_008967 [Pyrocoelia pectoralis]|uniref:Uncharacterized protein n=1 Tax=Pyrocoelia pectoralis TaxID=417401 RepID=A0AAN7ZE76_9COLE